MPCRESRGCRLDSSPSTGAEEVAATDQFAGDPWGLYVALGDMDPTLALTGNPAPAGGTFGGLGAPTLNDAGQVAFVTNLTGGSAQAGVFLGTPGALQAVALQGAAAPSGGTYAAFNPPVLGGAGQVAFRADLIGGSSVSGLFVGTPGAVQTAALQGAPAPGGGTYATFTPPQLNTPGQIAFLAALAGAGVDATNDLGLYAGSPGTLAKVVRKGDPVDVDPGPGVDLRTVAGIAYRGDSNTATGGQEGRA
jgi:hypothetical protein